MARETFTVSQLARRAGVTVRTLHHYDELGLLQPLPRGPGDRRLYGQGELRRLHDILLLRALGLPLADIAALLEAPAARRAEALEQQRERLVGDIARLRGVLVAIDTTISDLRGGPSMTTEDIRSNLEALEAEAEARWGETPQWAISQQRTKGYTEADWARIKAESRDILKEAGALLEAGEPPEGEAARAVAERHRRHIDAWFYPCPPEMHSQLTQLWEGDPRFRKTFEAVREGLTGFLAAAVRANAQPSG